MAYTPMIVIDYNDLHQHKSFIEEKANSATEEETRAYAELLEAMSLPAISFRQSKFIIIQPTPTHLNTMVRTIIHNLGIMFTVNFK